MQRMKAGQQLEEFAEKFFAMTESLPASPAPSPFPSLSELRQCGSRRDSVCSSASSQSSGISGVSI